MQALKQHNKRNIENLVFFNKKFKQEHSIFQKKKNKMSQQNTNFHPWQRNVNQDQRSKWKSVPFPFWESCGNDKGMSHRGRWSTQSWLSVVWSMVAAFSSNSRRGNGCGSISETIMNLLRYSFFWFRCCCCWSFGVKSLQLAFICSNE